MAVSAACLALEEALPVFAHVACLERALQAGSIAVEELNDDRCGQSGAQAQGRNTTAARAQLGGSAIVGAAAQRDLQNTVGRAGWIDVRQAARRWRPARAGRRHTQRRARTIITTGVQAQRVLGRMQR